MKFYLLQHGEPGDPNTLHAFDNAADRDAKTIECIFGHDPQCQHDAEEWDKLRAELIDRGCVSFEGDPGLDWFEAIPA